MTGAMMEDGVPDNAASTAGSSGTGVELNLFKTAVEAVGEAILITGPASDPQGPRIEYVNSGFVRMTGYGADEVVGRTPRMLQGPNTDRAFLDRLRAALEAGQSFQGEAVNYRKDGTEYVVEWLITPVMDRDGRITRWVSAQRDVTERRRAEEVRERLLAEVNHRVNNTLSAVQSLALQTLRTAPFSEGARAAFLGRLFALSRVHDLLARDHWAGVPLRDLAVIQAGHHGCGGTGRVEATGPDLLLRPGAAVTLGLALHELATNAAAHGALSVPGGRVRLAWSVGSAAAAEHLRLHWEERGGPTVAGSPARRGFGARLLERGLAQELRAEARLLFEPSGFRCEIDVPLSAIEGGLPPRSSPLAERSRCDHGRDGDGREAEHAGTIIAKLRQVEVLTAQGKPVAEAVRAIGVTEPTYYRWRSEYGGLKLDQVKRLKQLEAENARLRKAVADLAWKTA